jgi:hypothetical protein
MSETLANKILYGLVCLGLWCLMLLSTIFQWVATWVIVWKLSEAQSKFEWSWASGPLLSFTPVHVYFYICRCWLQIFLTLLNYRYYFSIILMISLNRIIFSLNTIIATVEKMVSFVPDVHVSDDVRWSGILQRHMLPIYKNVYMCIRCTLA